MFSSQQITTASPGLWFASNLAAASSLVVVVGWLCVWLCRRRPAPLQHGILLCTIAVTACAPLLLAASDALGWGLFRIEAPPAPHHVLVPELNRSESVNADATLATTASGQVTSEPVAPTAESVQPDALVQWETVSWRIVGIAALWIWVAGIAVGLAGHTIELIAVLRFRRSLTQRANQALCRLLNSAAGRQETQPAVDVYVSPLTTAPIALGLIRPIIVIPEYLAQGTSHEELRVVLLHEAAHIARRDQWVALLQRWTAIAYWWNPLLHLLNRRLRHVRELICDDHAARSQIDGRILAEVLVGVAERSVSPRLHAATALVQDEARSLEVRVRRLLERSNAAATRMSAFDRILAMTFALALASLLIAGHVRAADEPTAEVTAQVFRHNGAPAGNVEIVPVSLGYDANFLRRTNVLRTDDAGTLNVAVGSAYAARPDSDRPVFFIPQNDRERIQVPMPRPAIWARHVPQQLRPEQLHIDVSTSSDRGRDLLTVQLTNNSGFALILTKTDLSVAGDGWRVFPPDSEQRGGMNVGGHGGTVTLHLDWDAYVRSGLWCVSSMDNDRRERNWRGDPGLYVRINIADVSSAPFHVAPPEAVLAHQRPALSAQELKFAGRWLLKLPKGFEHRVTLTPLGRNRYRMTPQTLNMSGIYTVRGRQLRMLEPNDTRLTEFAWEAPGSSAMFLVEEPPIGKTGSSYLGATMTRLREDR